MFPEDAWSGLCKRTESARGRGGSVECALVDEYFDCFGKAQLNGKQAEALHRCLAPAVLLAQTTLMPMLFGETVAALSEMNPVIRAVCTYFLKHLRHSWLALENPRVDLLYAELRKFKTPVAA